MKIELSSERETPELRIEEENNKNKSKSIINESSCFNSFSPLHECHIIFNTVCDKTVVLYYQFHNVFMQGRFIMLPERQRVITFYSTTSLIFQSIPKIEEFH